ncbi:hypothetical protein V5799_017394 [Amblyomma americanum]|uniref:Uncharacterized protein n=1 Tax=Amblyomma americanum TaxID=6943 RepID=A0AAQ4F3E1_AMBAM
MAEAKEKKFHVTVLPNGNSIFVLSVTYLKIHCFGAFTSQTASASSDVLEGVVYVMCEAKCILFETTGAYQLLLYFLLPALNAQCWCS